ncbi:APA family basic amino acid/polyamine antiporter [Streptococcus gallinaceus]|uniref:APC family permease n=1 Tax=Streptococcus gallinaceus TaxID=165758 RepID=UPI00209C750F|nr:amino acid permease [Streptococcus gallinaceus]MCP1640035.1 APA family basic amino acid/polyamine antiporter [Streptococcus gallinaceus]MCP1770817.1 APA family basic amino acid/polyamine antiporter [Streptococcus gallinaceus]
METNMQAKPTYGLVTAIAMIVGIVIGSGIYFKVDDILNFAGGNVWLGMLVIALGAVSIVFGSLSISELALRSAASGGIFSYYERYIHPGLAASLGMFTAYVYLPTVIAVVTWVGANYTLGQGASLEAQILLALFYLFVLTVINIFGRVVAGYFQSLSTMVKIIPLVLIALIGLFWAGKGPSLPGDVDLVAPRNVGWGWLSGLVPLYFAYDGWTVVASIAPEVKSPKKNLPRALIAGPLIILVLYLLFFYGLNRILGPEFIMSTGNAAVGYAVSYLFGSAIGRALMVIVIISVLGVSNGMMLGTMRLPQAFASRGWIRSEGFARIHPKYQVSVAASLSVGLVTMLWLGVHYLVMRYNLLPGSDISEITIVFNNTSFIFLYSTVLGLYRKGEVKRKLTGLFSPVLAIVGSLILLVGSLMTNFVAVLCFMLFCLVFCLVAYAVYLKNQS